MALIANAPTDFYGDVTHKSVIRGPSSGRSSQTVESPLETTTHFCPITWKRFPRRPISRGQMPEMPKAEAGNFPFCRVPPHLAASDEVRDRFGPLGYRSLDDQT